MENNFVPSTNLSFFLSRFAKAHIAVIGDLILDRFWFGEVSRLSPEAPVPVLSIVEQIDVPGGAANVAANIRALGGSVSLFGVVGKDGEGRFLLDLLRKRGISTDHILVSSSYDTPSKTRVIGRGSLPQHIVRIDKEKITRPLPKSFENRMVRMISDNIDSFDLLVISDYAKANLIPRIARFIIRFSKSKNKKVIVDTKPSNIRCYKNAFLVAPNLKEAAEISGKSDLTEAGKRIQEMLNSNVLVTRGGEGMTLFQKNKKVNLKAKERKVFDPVGAGDTVMAGLALSLAAGASLKAAASVANHTAGIVVTKRGTATVTLGELREDLSR